MARKNSTLILKNLSEKTTLETLLNKFKKYGDLSGLRIRSSKKDSSLILGFLEYKSIEKAEKALEEIKKEEEAILIDENEIEIDYAIRQTQKPFNKKRQISAVVKGLENEKFEDKELSELLGCLKLEKKENDVIAFFKTNGDFKKALNNAEENKMAGKRISLEKIRY